MKTDELITDSDKTSKVKRNQRKIKFTVEMRHFVNSLLTSIEDKIEEIEYLEDAGKSAKDAWKELKDLVSESKFSIEEIVQEEPLDAE